MHHLQDGDILRLEGIISSHTLTVAVFYAPWSRASHHAIRDLSELSVLWGHNNTVGFLAVNCWLYLSLCRENFNSWEYPQILLYHREASYVPHTCHVNTFPPTLTSHIHSLVHPVLVVRSVEELGEVLVRHHRSVIGLFSDYQRSKDYLEFRRAAVHHHFDHYDIHHVPFIVLDTQYTRIIDRENRSYLIFKYALFETLTIFDGRQDKLRFRNLLDWLKPRSDSERPIERLNLSLFNALTINSESVILASPLHRHSDNYVNYMRNVISYRHCLSHPERKVCYFIIYVTIYEPN